MIAGVTRIFQIIGVFKYIFFLGLGGYFITQGDVLLKFNIKRTSFSEYNEPLSEMPSIMTKVVYSDNRIWNYQEDFTISYHNIKGQATNLTFGQNMLIGIDIMLDFVHIFKEFLNLRK